MALNPGDVKDAARTQPESPDRRADMHWLPQRQAGVYINEDVALTYSAVWAAIGVISDDLSALPFNVLRRTEGGRREDAPELPAARVLDSPNPEIEPFLFRQVIQAHALTWGNGYAEIERDLSGRPLALWPIPPDRVRLLRTEAGRLVYEVRNYDGGTVGIPFEDMFHIRGLGWDGLKGYSVIAYAARNLGLSVATEEFGASFFGNGSTIDGVLQHPGQLSEAGAAALEKSWTQMHQGPKKAHRIAILEEGMEYAKIGVPPEDGQFLETREFQVTDVARWFRVPPHKIADLKRATFSNIEEQNIDYASGTLAPWATRWEQEANRKLLGRQSRLRYYTKINLNGLLRGALEKRYAAYATGRQWGWLSANDVRRLEDMDPLPAEQGDIYLSPSNMVPTELLGDMAEQDNDEPEPTPTPATQEEAPQADPGQMVDRAFAAVFDDITSRLMAREVNRLRRRPQKARTGQGFSDWLSKYYAETHYRHVQESISVAAGAYATACGAENAEIVALVVETSARAYCDENLEQALRAGEDGDLESFYERAERAWPMEAATEIQSKLKNAFTINSGAGHV